MSVIEQIERANLLGRGGAAFPTATKWRAVANRSRGNDPIESAGSSRSRMFSARNIAARASVCLSPPI